MCVRVCSVCVCSVSFPRHRNVWDTPGPALCQDFMHQRLQGHTPPDPKSVLWWTHSKYWSACTYARTCMPTHTHTFVLLSLWGLAETWSVPEAIDLNPDSNLKLDRKSEPPGVVMFSLCTLKLVFWSSLVAIMQTHKHTPLDAWLRNTTCYYLHPSQYSHEVILFRRKTHTLKE